MTTPPVLQLHDAIKTNGVTARRVRILKLLFQATLSRSKNLARSLGEAARSAEMPPEIAALSTTQPFCRFYTIAYNSRPAA
ncbi:MAG: hypothetical protein K8F25_00040 [Fimbriimonadaceae bacterium]|nr:hypothetical protein [Alphaproteobacteria bacterium]